MANSSNDTDRSAADLLRTAAGLISERGHAKGQYVEQDGSMCALGALYSASRQQAYRFDAAAGAMSRYVDSEFGLGIVGWNDAPGTSGEDVILAMKTVAEQLDDRS